MSEFTNTTATTASSSLSSADSSALGHKKQSSYHDASGHKITKPQTFGDSPKKQQRATFDGEPVQFGAASSSSGAETRAGATAQSAASQATDKLSEAKERGVGGLTGGRVNEEGPTGAHGYSEERGVTGEKIKSGLLHDKEDGTAGLGKHDNSAAAANVPKLAQEGVKLTQ